MSFPNPPPPPVGGDGAKGLWPPTLLNQEQSEMNSESDQGSPSKRQRSSENTQLDSAPFPPMNPRVNLPNNPPPNWWHPFREQESGAGSWNDDQKGESCSSRHERPPRFKRDMMKDQRESCAIHIQTTNSNMARSDSNKLEINKHPPRLSSWKTKLCGKYEIAGHCPLGERCQFAHGQSELQASSCIRGANRATNFRPVPLPTPAPAPAGSSFPGKGEQEDKQFRLWKSTKKLSGIYADWIDEENPPHHSSGQE